VGPTAADRCEVRGFVLNRRLTGLGTRLFGMGLLLALLAVPTQSRWLLAAGCFAVALPFASLISLPGSRPELEVESPLRGRVGVPSTLRLHVRNGGRRRLPALELRCVRPLFEPAVGAIGALARGQQVTWDLIAVPLARGTVTHLHVEVTASDLLGLTQQRSTQVLPVRLLVAPAPVPTVPLPELRAGGTDTELAGLRPWHPADPGSAIAWRASARRGFGPTTTLLAREWHDTEPDDLCVGLTGGPAATLERALEVLAAIGCAALVRGRTVTLRLGRESRPLTRPEQLLDALAGLAVVPERIPSGCDVLITCRGGPPAGLPTGRLLVVDDSGRVELR
jgi:uncharacterized protein (DUF58 family)